jgi:sodium/potassium/calcium exchanger 6
MSNIATINSFRHQRMQSRKGRSRYESFFGLLLISVVCCCSLFETGENMLSHGAINDDPAATRHLSSAPADGDFSEYSCDELYRHAKDKATQCAYARTCNDGDGIFAPAVYCSERYSSRTLLLLLGAPLALLLIVLFRILGSTAEEFFSPGLEMFSIKLGLPERFAGVTLLALGNGAPDVASTVNAIRNDRKRGYLLALGELTGAAMVASTVIVGAVAFVSIKPVPCRGAFVRDVVMFIITMILVFSAFNDGTINPKEIRMFVGLYLCYVAIVLAADVYHRKVVAAEQQLQSSDEDDEPIEEEEEPSETTALKAAAPGKLHAMSVGSYELSHKKADGGAGFWSSFTSSRPPGSPPVMRRVMEAISNYDEIPEIDEIHTMGSEEETSSDGAQRHLEHASSSSGWGEKTANGSEPLMVFHPHHGGIVDLKHMESLGSSDEEGVLSWLDVRQELTDYFVNFWRETYYSAEYNVVDKFLMTCELPFTFLRMAS